MFRFACRSKYVSPIAMSQLAGDKIPDAAADGNAMVVQLVLPRTSSAEPKIQQLNGALVPSINPSTISGGFNRLVGGQSSVAIGSGVYSAVSNSNDTMSSLVVGKGDGQPFRRLVDEPNSSKVPSDSVSSLSNHGTTSDAEKRLVFKKYLTIILSCIYGSFIVMLGLVVYVAALLDPKVPIAEVFNIYLTMVGIVWLVFLHIDLRFYLNSVSALTKQENPTNYQACEDHNAIDAKYQMDLSSQMKKIPIHYCFMTGRHSGSFYLKIGAAAFCFGHMIHEGLLLSRQIIYFTSEEPYRTSCANTVILILDIVHPIFSFYQLFMIFKYSNVVINRFREVARFAVMHIIAANLCFWINTIIRETIESLQHKLMGNHTPEPLMVNGPFTNATPQVIMNDNEYETDTIYAVLNKTHMVNGSICVSKTVLSAFTIQAAPYLYPFTIEYSLLVVGVWFIVWHNIGKIEGLCIPVRNHQQYGTEPAEDFTSNLVIHVDCHSANRGLFAGLFVLLATVISVIIFFVAVMNQDYVQTGIIINNSSDIVLLIMMSLSVLFAYRQITQLDINRHAVTFLDDILLFVALPCFFLYGIFNVVAGMAANNVFSIVSSILSVIQVILQTPFIIDGLRRCSNSQGLRFKKPGRELVTFLIVCNVAMWILETFEIKTTEAHWDKIEFYGKILWTFLSHITLPLTLFYRFHSSVCLVDIWKSAYEAGE